MSQSQPMPQAFDHALRALKPLKPESYELFFSISSSLKIEAKDAKVDSLTKAEDVGLSVRLMRDGKIGFSYTTSLEPSAIEKAVKSAWDIAPHMSVEPHATLGEFSKQIPPMSERFDLEGLNTPKKLSKLCFSRSSAENKILASLEFEAQIIANHRVSLTYSTI